MHKKIYHHYQKHKKKFHIGLGALAIGAVIGLVGLTYGLLIKNNLGLIKQPVTQAGGIFTPVYVQKGRVLGAKTVAGYSAENKVMKANLPLDIIGPVNIAQANSAYSVSMNLEGANNSLAQLKNDNSILYPEALSNTDIEYQPIASGLKESIILKSSKKLPEQFIYTFNADDLAVEINSDNEIIFTQISEEPSWDIPVDDGTIIPKDKARQYLPAHPQRFKIPAPYMTDNSGSRSDADAIQIKIEDNKLILIPDKKWLNSAKFPVILDPTIETVPQIIEETANLRSLNSNHFRTDQNNMIGVFHAGQVNYYDSQDDKYKPIDTTLISTNVGWQMERAGYNLVLPPKANDWFEIHNNMAIDTETKKEIDLPDESIKMRALGVENIDGYLVQDGDWANKKVVYKNSFAPGADLELIAKNDAFVKEVVINQKSGDLSKDLEFSFELEFSDDFTIETDGEVWDTQEALITSDSIILGKLRKIWFRKFILYDAAGNQGEMKIKLEKIGPRKVKLTKILDKNFLEKAVYPVRTDGSMTFNSEVGDGYISGNGTGWSTVQGATSGIADYLGNTAYVGSRKDGGDNIYSIYRAFYAFDTSTLPADAIISSSSMQIPVQYFYLENNDSLAWISVYQASQASVNSLIGEDYDNISAISGSNTVRIENIGSVFQPTFNATGMSWINKTGYTKIGVREGHDAQNTPITGGINVRDLVLFATKEDAVFDPSLSVTYTSGISINSLTFINPYGANQAIANDLNQQFKVAITDYDGCGNIDYVSLHLGNSIDNTYPSNSLKLNWTQSADSFIEVFDTQNAITVSGFSSLGAFGCSITFNVKFNPNFTNLSTNYNAWVEAVDDYSNTAQQTYSNFYQVIKAPNDYTCTFGDQCQSDLCIGGATAGTAYCRAADSCSSYQAKGCSRDTNLYDNLNAGTCTSTSCDYMGEVRADWKIFPNIYYDTCDATSGDACDQDAGGQFVQNGTCIDGPVCYAEGYICFNGSVYQSNCSCYIQGAGSVQKLCDSSPIGGGFNSEGICTANNSECATAGVSYDDEMGDYRTNILGDSSQIYTNNVNGDSCDIDVTGSGYYKEGMAVYSGGSLSANCDAFGGIVRVDTSNRFVADCDSSGSLCDNLTVDGDDPFSANGLCVQNTCDTNHIAKNCNYAEPNCSNYFNLCSEVSNNDRCYTGGISYTDNGVCAAGSCVVKTANEAIYCFDGIDNDGDGPIDLADTDCSGGPVPFIQTVASVNQNTGDLNITINANGNPADISYALYNTTLGKYVTQSGTLQVSEFWRLNALSWINLDLDTVGGAPGQPFTYQVKAKGPGPETVLSNVSDPNATHATYPAVPGSPSVSNLASGTSQKIIINKNGNYNGATGGVEYRIEVTSPSGAFAGTKYVPVGGGNLTDTANNWATYQGWGSSAGVNASGLTTGQTYSYKLKARNTNQEETTTLSSATVLQVQAVSAAGGALPVRLNILKEVINPADGILTAAGQTVTFRITVKNSGIEPTSVEYTITDILPPGFIFLGNITAKNPSGMIVSGSCNIGNLTCDGRTLKWTLNEVINNGSQISFKYEAVAP